MICRQASNFSLVQQGLSQLGVPEAPASSRGPRYGWSVPHQAVVCLAYVLEVGTWPQVIVLILLLLNHLHIPWANHSHGVSLSQEAEQSFQICCGDASLVR